MIRQIVKTAAAVGLHATGADRLIGALDGRGARPLVLCYHRVVEDVRAHPSSAPAMLVSRATLERQLDWLGRRFRFVDLDELAEGLAAGRRGSRPVAAVTFDDGYADVYHHGFPLLRRKGIPAAVFVVTDLVGTTNLQLHDELYILLRRTASRLGAAGLASVLGDLAASAGPRLAGDPVPPHRLAGLSERLLRTLPRTQVRRLLRRLARQVEVPDELRAELAPVDWSMLGEMRAAGITVGSHTCRHRVLPNEPQAVVRSELAGSKRALEAALGTEIAHLAYPDGQFCPSALEAAKAAGYRYAYTTCSHRSPRAPLLTIPRTTFWERSAAGLVGSFSPAVAACHIHGVFARLNPCRASHGLTAAAPAAAPGGTAS